MDALLCLHDWLNPHAQGVGDFAFFKLISEYFDHKIDQFGLRLMARMMQWVGAISLTLVTLWVMIAGYRMATGQSRDSMMGLVVSMTRIAVILSVATSMAWGGTNLHRFVTVDLDREIHSLFVGSAQSSSDAIDKNLAFMQVALSAIDAVQVPDKDPALQRKKEQALLFAGIGTASPPMAAGAMQLLFKFSIALSIGLAPLFILCLVFEQTKDLFRRWLLYTVGTLFSMSLLSVVTGWVMELMAKIAVLLWVNKALNGILGSAAEGMTTQAMFQGGIGLLMTVLIVTAPPLAAAYFQGTLGNFMSYSAFAGKDPGKDRNVDAVAPTTQTQSRESGDSGLDSNITRTGDVRSGAPSQPNIHTDSVKDKPRKDREE